VKDKTLYFVVVETTMLKLNNPRALMKKEQTCKITRWQLLKQKLNNLLPDAFGRALEQESGALLLDVRTPAEYEDWAIPQSINIDYLSYDLIDQLEKLDRAQTYFVYCRTGRRSIRVCTLMRNSGFEGVYNLEGGLVAWHAYFGTGE